MEPSLISSALRAIAVSAGSATVVAKPHRKSETVNKREVLGVRKLDGETLANREETHLESDYKEVLAKHHHAETGCPRSEMIDWFAEDAPIERKNHQNHGKDIGDTLKECFHVSPKGALSDRVAGSARFNNRRAVRCDIG